MSMWSSTTSPKRKMWTDCILSMLPSSPIPKPTLLVVHRGHSIILIFMCPARRRYVSNNIFKVIYVTYDGTVCVAGLHRTTGPKRCDDRGQRSRGVGSLEHCGHPRGSVVDAEECHCDHRALQNEEYRLLDSSHRTVYIHTYIHTYNFI